MTTQHDGTTGRPRRGADTSTATEQALVARLQALTTEAATGPDPAFRAATRSRLVAMAAVRSPAETPGRRSPVQPGGSGRLPAGAPGAPGSPAARWRKRLTAGLTGAVVVVAVLGGLLAAAQDTRRGDLLYELKRGGEQARLALAGDSRRGPTLLGFASTRLDELGALVGAQAGPDVDLVVQTLRTMDEETAEGTAAVTSRAVREVDPDAVAELAGWAESQEAGLSELADAVPAGAERALAGSQDLVGRITARGNALVEALACPGGPSTRGADDLGPLPAACRPPMPGTRGHGATPAPSSVPSATGPAGRGTAPTGADPAAPAPRLPSGGVPPVPQAPATSGGPALPLPQGSDRPLPTPGQPATSLPTGSPGAVPVLPPAPRASVCAPPLVTVGC